jgi:hypothetical protein
LYINTVALLYLYLYLYLFVSTAVQRRARRTSTFTLRQVECETACAQKCWAHRRFHIANSSLRLVYVVLSHSICRRRSTLRCLHGATPWGATPCRNRLRQRLPMCEVPRDVADEWGTIRLCVLHRSVVTGGHMHRYRNRLFKCLCLHEAMVAGRGCSESDVFETIPATGCGINCLYTVILQT